MPLALILAVGAEPIDLSARTFILRAAGYVVESTLSINQAIQQLQAGDFDLVVLCHSMCQLDRDRLACSIRATGSRIPIVTVAPSREQFREGFSDAFINEAPKQLLEGVEIALQDVSKLRRTTRMGVSRLHADGESRHTILCVDDDSNVLEIRRRLLGAAGLTVLTATSGSDGLKIFSTGVVDVAILDYSMPLMNGGVAAAQMRQIDGTVPLILCSGYSDIPEEDRALFDRFIPKGTLPSTLISTIREVLHISDMARIREVLHISDMARSA